MKEIERVIAMEGLAEDMRERLKNSYKIVNEKHLNINIPGSMNKICGTRNTWTITIKYTT